eukprot:TRINITY_DN31317_c0_g1_i1.p1 TRINITY_DN31317_c0_g1~~TRINITY_DN31317_c0_g1_i1.p1  ORF type:complete len:480 (+),score=120.63 TRINITY_DN31317_c0_g1_i1:97-1440(+)
MAPKAAAKGAAKAKAEAKKTPKPRGAPPAPKLKREPSRKEDVMAAEDIEKLSNVVQEMFLCYDEDQDGQIERVEFLDGEERRVGKMDYGPKQRKESMAWFKDAGATGTPVDGMYISEEQFKAATLKTAAADSGIGEDKPAELAEWLWENRAKALIQGTYKSYEARLGEASAEKVSKVKAHFKSLDANSDGFLDFGELHTLLEKGCKEGEKMPEDDVKKLFAKVNKSGNGKVTFDEFVDFVFDVGGAATGGGGSAAPGTALPEYPLTIDFKHLQERINEAASLGRNVLILSNEKTEVETFLQYRNNILIDCREIIGGLYVKKDKKEEEVKAELKQKLTTAMNSSGFCKQIHIRFHTTACDFQKLCFEGFPDDVFASKAVWTIEKAFSMGFFDSSHKFNLEVEDEKKWKDFQLILTSHFSLEKANEFLIDKIPHFDELAILVIDPKSIS